MRDHLPILIFLTIFLVLPLAFCIVIGVLKHFGWKPGWQTRPRGFEVTVGKEQKLDG